MTDLFNPWLIVGAQIDTLREFDTRRYSPAALSLFFGIPFLTAAGLLAGEITITEGAANALITSMSIFAGLLFNLLLLVYDVVNRAPRPRPSMSNEERRNAAIRQQFLSEVFSNISFAIFASVVVVLLLLAGVLVSRTGNRWFSGVVFYCTMTFLMTLLMVLQRVHILFGKLPRAMTEVEANLPDPAAEPPATGRRHLRAVSALEVETEETRQPLG